MKIVNKVLVLVSESDIVDGKFVNKTVTSVADNCFFNLPSLRAVSLPKVEKIGSDCFRSNQALTEVNLPALTTAGSDCFSYNQALTEVNLPALTTAGSDCFSYNQALTEVNLGSITLQVKDVDGYCFVVEQTKSTKGIKIYSGYNLVNIDNTKIIRENSFVAEKDNFYAHGETVKKAISDVQFKIVAEKLKNEPILPDTVITINHYRLITGACEMGVNSWMERTFDANERKSIADKGIKASDLFPILKRSNAYGFDRFNALMQGNF